MIRKSLLIILFISLFFPPGVFCKETPGKKGDKSKLKHSQQISAFRIKKNAERFVRKLRKDRVKAEIRKGVTNNKKTVYRVYLKKSKGPHKYALFSRKTVEDRTTAMISAEERPASSFLIKKNAKKFAKKMRREGFETEINKVIAKDKRTFYRVYARKAGGAPKDYLYPGETKKNADLEKLPAEEDKPAVAETISGEPTELSRNVLPPGEIKRDTISEAPPAEENKPAVAETISGEPTELSQNMLSPGEIRRDTISEAPPAVEDKAAVAETISGKPTELSQNMLSPGEIRKDTISEVEPPEDRPVGTIKPSQDIFEKKRDYIRTSLTVAEVFTDNAFYSKEDKKSDLSTVLTPEIIFALPSVNHRLLEIGDTSNRSPGAFVLSRAKPEVLRRYYTYLLYLADIPLSSKNSPSGNTITHNLRAGFKYNIGSNLYVDFIDQFVRSYEARRNVISTELEEVDKYKNNLFNAMLSYDTGRKFNLRFDYTNFALNYDSTRNKFRDRVDNSLTGYLFYKFKPKTAAFVEYSFIDISYKNESSLDSKERHLLGGLQWDVTAKSTGSVKAGYGTKDFTASKENAGNYILEAEVKHKFTTKTIMALSVFRKTNETNMLRNSYILTNGIGVNYQQLITSKITCSANLLYTNDRYKGDVTPGGETKETRDNVYQTDLGLQYEFKKWLKSGVGYIFTKRDSNFSYYNFSSNTFFFRVTGSY